MKVVFNNGTYNHSGARGCQMEPHHFAAYSLIDVVTFLMGQPVITKLLWIVFKSKKTADILNLNLALFHNSQYFVSILHLFCVFLWPEKHMKILKFLFVYAESGGPMSLTFICLERYYAVIYPTSYHLLKKYRFREFCASSVWLISFPLALMTVFVRQATPEHVQTVLRSFPAGLMMTMTIMMVWCSSKVARELRKSGPGRDALHPVKKKALRTVCATSIITIFCYTPVTLLQKVTYGLEHLYECMTTPICIFFLSAASVVHPLFYLSTQGQLCPCFKKGKKIP